MTGSKDIFQRGKLAVSATKRQAGEYVFGAYDALPLQMFETIIHDFRELDHDICIQ
jgi:hypothetical protein